MSALTAAVSPSPSPAATAATAAATATATAAVAGEDEEVDEEDGSVDVNSLPLAEAIGKLQQLYFEKHQQEPSQEMVAQWRQVLSEAQEEGEGEGEEEA